MGRGRYAASWGSATGNICDLWPCLFVVFYFSLGGAQSRNFFLWLLKWQKDKAPGACTIHDITLTFLLCLFLSSPMTNRPGSHNTRVIVTFSTAIFKPGTVIYKGSAKQFAPPQIRLPVPLNDWHIQDVCGFLHNTDKIRLKTNNDWFFFYII